MTKLNMKSGFFLINIVCLLIIVSLVYSIQIVGKIDFAEGTMNDLIIRDTKSISSGDNFWSDITSPGPPARYMHSMAIDNHNQTIILFGGATAYDPFDDTWAYNLTENSWTQMSPPFPPPLARSRYSIVYNSNADKFILFGGLYYSPATYLNDTWVYDLATDTWTSRDPSTSPSGRAAHSMVYDSNSDRVILFGGNNGTGGVVFNDTWIYDYAADTWTQMNPSIAPINRWYTSMAYDSYSNKVILFGGTNGTIPELDDTWVYDLAADTWTQMNPFLSPPKRSLPAMVYDSNSDKVILFGGVTGTNSFSDTWVYDLSTDTWTPLNPSSKPSVRHAHSMVYDSTSDQVILFGGHDGTLTTGPYFGDTWAYSYELPFYLLSPEDKTYTIPRATYGFENEPHATEGLNLEFIDEYSTAGQYVGIGVHDGPIYGQYKVLHIGDAQAATYTYGVHYFDNPPTAGTIEFFLLVDNIHSPYTGANYFHLRAMDDTIAVEMRINAIGQYLSKIEYFNGVSWQTISDQISYKWYHHSISFDCEAGVNGQFNWTISNELRTEVGLVENIEFQNDLNTVDELYLASDVPTYFGATRWDAFGFSWDPNYNVGDNLNERLILSYFTPEPLIWTGYSLDGGTNITIFGNTSIPIPALGTHTIQIVGNVTTGDYYRSELRSFQIRNPPSAPLNLLATAGENSVMLSWSTPSSDGGSAITHYNIYRRTTTDSYSFLGITASTTFTDTSAAGGTTYYYVVTAVNSVGESIYSNEASATPTVPTTSPTTTPTTASTTEKDGQLTSFPGVLIIFLAFSTLTVFTRRNKKT